MNDKTLRRIYSLYNYSELTEMLIEKEKLHREVVEICISQGVMLADFARERAELQSQMIKPYAPIRHLRICK